MCLERSLIVAINLGGGKQRWDYSVKRRLGTAGHAFIEKLGAKETKKASV